MKVTFEITNQELFNAKIVDVDASGLKNRGTDEKGKPLGFYGDLEIEEEGVNGWVTTTGEFGSNDYEDGFGFILKAI